MSADDAYVTPAAMTRVEFPAMGTTVSLLLPEGGPAEEGGEIARALFAEWEAVLSRFRPESELSRLNARAGEPMAVSALLYEVLDMALRAAAATDGVYDPTLLRQLVAAGYSRSFDDLPQEQASLVGWSALAPGGGWRGIWRAPARREVRLPRGVGLDFGGIAKGMAVDATLALLRARGFELALVNAGGDLAVAGLPSGEPAWHIAVPGAGDERWSVPLARGAMATSGIARRQWRQGGERRHHLLDPRTGAPAENGLWSVSVVAATCARAEVAAKAAFVLGPAEGAAFLERIGVAGLLVVEDGRRVVAGPWPDDLRTLLTGAPQPVAHAAGVASGAPAAEERAI
jgi:thiamine biosynthesis lipoprotein